MKILAIVRKELKEYMLKPGSISWGLIFPLVFTLSFIVRFGDVDHLAPGLVSISALFATTSFVASSLIFERRLKTFERLLLAPVRYGEVIFAKILVGALFGTMVSIITLLILMNFLRYGISHPVLTLIVITMANFTFSAFGVYLSLATKNPINVMSYLNLLRLPMIFTSGAIASLSLFPKWFTVAGIITPLTYSVESLRFAILNYYDIIPFEYSVLLLSIIGLLFFIMSVRTLKKLY